MYYYSFHIGDYRAATAHLTNEEDLAYRRLLDWYYDNESFISLSETDHIARRIRVDVKVMERVLLDMFTLDEHGKYRNARADSEISAYHEKLQQASNAGKASAKRRFNARSTPVQLAISDGTTGVQPTKNQEPLTINQEPLLKKQRGSRLPQDFLFPKEWADFCHEQRPDLNIQKTFDSFKDYWVSKPGAGGVKLDWLATWRNWVRTQSVPKASFAQINADVARTTVPENSGYERTQARLAAEASIKRSGPSLEVLERLAAIRNGAGQSQ